MAGSRTVIGYLSSQDGAILTTHRVLRKLISLKAIIITNPLLTTPVWSRWFDIGIVHFLHVYGLSP